MARTGEQIINSKDGGVWAECRICRDTYRRQRLTKLYCSDCKNAFCDGEHGHFVGNSAKCVICGAKKNYRDPQEQA